MRILHLIQRPQLRGAETFASQIGAIHHRDGHEVCFVALFKAPGTELQLNGPELVKLDANEGSRFADLEGWRKLGQFIKEYKPDIIQANAADTLKYAVFSKLLTGWNVPLIYRNANKAGDFINSRIKKMYNKWLVGHADYVASVSQNCSEDFIQTFNFPKDRISNMPIGTPIVDVPVVSDIRKELGIGAEMPLLVNISSFVPEKNHLGLLDIFAQIIKSGKQCHLLIVGDGKMRQQIEEKKNSLGLQDTVHMLGYRRDAVSILKQCDVMLMPSFIEGLPGVILEAMANNVAVVASEVGGIGEVIKNNDTGFTADPKLPDSFIKPVLKLLEDSSLKKRITDSAFTFCSENLDIEIIARQFLDVYLQQKNTGNYASV